MGRRTSALGSFVLGRTALGSGPPPPVVARRAGSNFLRVAGGVLGRTTWGRFILGRVFDPHPLAGAEMTSTLLASPALASQLLAEPGLTSALAIQPALASELIVVPSMTSFLRSSR